MNKSKKLKNKIILLTIAVSICTTIIIAGIMTYRFSDRIIEYKYAHRKANSNTSSQISSSEVEYLPESEYYTVKLYGNTICVYDSDRQPIYCSLIDNINSFTEKDIKELEEEGIKYTTRTELIEMLNYIKT